MTTMIELQRKLIGDRGRNEAFAEALRQSIVPGKSTVSDLGAGTGFLSFLAERFGAAHCYLYENGSVAELCKRLLKRNKLERCTLSRSHSAEVEKPVQTDIVVSETLGNFAYEEHIIETMADARRFLKPGGTLIPQTLTQSASPVTNPRLWEELNVWDGVGYDMDFAEAKELTLNNMYVKTVTPADLLDGGHQAEEFDAVDFRDTPQSRRQGECEWTLAKAATVYGFCIHWDCTLIEGVQLSTSPLEPATHWEQIFLPLLRPLEVPVGGTLHLEVASDTRWETGVHVRWTARTDSDVIEMDMAKGWME